MIGDILELNVLQKYYFKKLAFKKTGSDFDQYKRPSRLVLFCKGAARSVLSKPDTNTHTLLLRPQFLCCLTLLQPIINDSKPTAHTPRQKIHRIHFQRTPVGTGRPKQLVCILSNRCRNALLQQYSSSAAVQE